MTDPNWPRAKEWLEGRYTDVATMSLGILGVPLHRASISQSRADLAPAALRAALFKYSVYDVENERDLRSVALHDEGDMMLFGISPEEALGPVSERIRELRARNDVVVALGGDNSITRPVMHGLGSLDRLGLITFDAHFDLRELEDGLTNGNPVRALLADGLVGGNVAQIGIQPFANSPRHAEVAREAGIHVVARSEIADRGIETVVSEALDRIADEVDAIHVDVDIDVLDRAFAPATPGSRPGGLSPLELRRAVTRCGAHAKVVGADIVEVSPPDDVADVTSLTAAQMLLAFISGVAARATKQS